MIQAFVRSVFRFVHWVRTEPNDVQTALLNFIYAMVCCIFFMGALFGLAAMGVIA